MRDRNDERRRYGQHYTPVEVARLLAAFAVRRAGDTVLDPSCGDGRLLAEALRVKGELAGRRAARGRRAVFGVERSVEAARRAASTGAPILCADFFEVQPGAAGGDGEALPARFDAVIGNPPYVRQEILGPRDKRRIEECLREDRDAAPELFWPAWSRRSDLYVYFFAHAARFLGEGGRLVFLTAASWLDVGYGAPLREFLLKNFRIVCLLESAVESFFADASVNTVIAVLERCGDAAARMRNGVKFVQLRAPLAGLLEGAGPAEALALARRVEDLPAAPDEAALRVRTVSQAELSCAPPAADGWGRYLRADDIFFHVLARGGPRLRPLGDVARVRFGVKTGANRFFYLGDGENGERWKRLGEVARVRRGLTTGANEFFYLKSADGKAESSAPATLAIEPRFLKPVIFSLKEIPGIVLSRRQATRLLFHCEEARERLAGTAALGYIERGERAGYHRRPSCAARQPWYAVARRFRPAPLLFPSKVGERWLVALNRDGVFEDKKLYGVFPLSRADVDVLGALLNSTWARYHIEITCRQMTGAQAIADIDVAVAEGLLLPDPRGLSPALRRRLEGALKALARRPIGSIFEEVRRADRRRLDDATLAAIGFKDRGERRRALEDLYAAMTRLVGERLRKSDGR